MKFPKKTLRDVPLDGKTVLMRADYNVPLDSHGRITDDFRINQNLPTLQHLLERGCKVIICAHLGRPDGQVVPAFSFEPVAERLSKLLGQHVTFVRECIGDQVIQAVKHLAHGQVALLENLRFHAGEQTNEAAFAEELAASSSADYFVQDAFGVVHEERASTSAITRYLPSVAGLLLEREYMTITAALDHPKRPLVAVLGGAKISDKIKVIKRFVAIADHLIIGGAMANTFLKYKGKPIGKSIHENGLDNIVQDIYEAAHKKTKGDPDSFITLPVDGAVARKIDAGERRCVVAVDDVHQDEMILDIGFDSIEEASEILKTAGTVVWNGTLGYAELSQFSHGSARIALELAQQPQTVSIVGGGDTSDFVLKWDAKKGASFSHVSTGGGASLQLMAGEPMPGIEALLDA